MLGNITAFQCVAEIMLQCCNIDSTQDENRCGQGHWLLCLWQKFGWIWTRLFWYCWKGKYLLIKVFDLKAEKRSTHQGKSQLLHGVCPLTFSTKSCMEARNMVKKARKRIGYLWVLKKVHFRRTESMLRGFLQTNH